MGTHCFFSSADVVALNACCVGGGLKRFEMGKRSKALRKRKRDEQQRSVSIDVASGAHCANQSVLHGVNELCSFLSQVNPLEERNVFYSEPLKPLRRRLRPLLAALLEKRGKVTKKERKKQRSSELEKKRALMDFVLTTEESLDALSEIFSGESGEISLHVETVDKLRSLPSLEGKSYKRLRTALHPFVLSLIEETSSSLSAQCSCAFRDGRQKDALRLLSDMRSSRHPPKLGALQRWVRDCMNENDFAGLQSKDAVELLDGIMRLQPIEWAWKKGEPESGEDGLGFQKGGVRRHKPLSVIPRAAEVPTDPSEIKYLEAQDNAAQPRYMGECGTCSREERLKRFRQDMKIQQGVDYNRVFFQKGAHRRPRNRYDLEIYQASKRLVKFNPLLDEQNAQKHYQVPSVPGAIFVSNVLSAEECEQIISLAESSPKGYVPDEPLTSAPPPEGFAPRAANFVLLSKIISGKLYDRTKKHLPEWLGGEGEQRLVGLNERLRLYRYQPGAIYRPHIDGSWAGSGIHNGEYVYDYFGDRWSKLTFLVYLNDDFAGGGTAFYTPSSKVGTIDAHTVEPRQGSVLVFPHGLAASLVHEGCFCERGVKYIIRTDALYSIPSHAIKEWD